MDVKQSAVEQAAATYALATQQWGAFRRWLSAHPLTGFWAGVGVGSVIRFAIGAIWNVIF